ncbi:Glyoxalase/bleomycin resistance protein/dioxygenase [Candidatus Terasakiella magnetica]|uniref:Glyoxalase/bleomycin resistance protein/dioxygenase n=1 Tax=Candidatus Terasakiella magnetica TaxID=1867952 RepID=A0A1C3RIA0_9PROT|nr:VOC family protein [Candidatus Terasakiella magnetica]SCA57008.1 Glyoxalase/bleomycin resistance protein/dioxygenase [Candidatus Terasakiella magnetica]
MLNAIDAIRIFSGDFQETKTFFVEAVGFEIGFEDEGVCVFDLAGTKLILEEVDLSEPEAAGMVGRFTGVSFATDDIKSTYKELSAKGVHFEGKPETEEWGGAMAHFKDPAGNVFTLVQYPPQN